MLEMKQCSLQKQLHTYLRISRCTLLSSHVIDKSLHVPVSLEFLTLLLIYTRVSLSMSDVLDPVLDLIVDGYQISNQLVILISLKCGNIFVFLVVLDTDGV